MSISRTVEVESKFEVGQHVAAPTPGDFAPLSADEAVEHALSAVYYDTPDLSLTRHKVTLRRRTGGSDEGWHLKLPGQAGRLELHAPLGDEVPDELVRAVAGLVRHRPLTPIARIDNRRRVVLLRDPEGAAVVEFCDDRVSTESFLPGGSASEWREWEAELVDPDLPHSAEASAGVTAACLAAGATVSSSSSKLARAVGPVPDAWERGVSPVRDALGADLDRLLDHDPAARSGTVTGVHQMRVATRGLRSTLATYSTELAADAAAAGVRLDRLRDELKALAAVLGGLRDLHVVDERLTTAAATYPDDVVSPLTRRRLRFELDAAQERARERVAAALGSDRYLDLLDRLHRLVTGAGAAQTDPGRGTAQEGRSGKDGRAERAGTAERDAEAAILGGLDRQFVRFDKTLRRAARSLDEPDLPLSGREALTHRVRKQAKALRRSVHSLPEDSRLRSAPLREACDRLHDVLGEIQDSVTARQWIRRIARRAEAAGESSFGFGVLFEHERAFSERAVAGFPADAAAVTAGYRQLADSRRRRRGKKHRTKRRKKSRG